MIFPRLIGITGRKFAGKDSAAGALSGYENVKFAGALKEMVRGFYRYVGVDAVMVDRLIDGDLKEVANEHFGGQTTRRAMQTLGTEWGRDLICKDLWIIAFIARSRRFDKVVCTDVRFPNEIATIKALGGVTIRIVDPHFVPTENEHESEALIDNLKVDAVVINDKAIMNIVDLHESVLVTLAHLGGTRT